MFKIDSNTKQIDITRGDMAVINIGAKNSNGSNYTFKAGDVIRFKVVKCKDCNCVALLKDFDVTEETEIVPIKLTGEDTKIGDITHKPVTYWYEVEINPGINSQTIIGYDTDGPKLFIVYPEGADQ